MERKSKLNRRFDKQFGLFVKKTRIARGLSQADLASMIGNNYQNVSRIERGELTPTIFWCYKLAEAFEMEMEDFIMGIGFTLNK
jgi:DNA-binding XRE family transcriptional regulator